MRTMLSAITMMLLVATMAWSSDKNAAVGRTVETKPGESLLMQRVVTTPATNTLPPVSFPVESDVVIPNSGMVTSTIKWVSSDATAIGNDVVMAPTGSMMMIGWNLNSPRVSFHLDESNIPQWEHLSNPNVYRNFVALSANADVVANASYQNLYLFDKNSGTITFNFTIPDNRIAGPVAVSRDGMLLVCATSSPLSGGIHRVYAFNPPSTTPVWTFDFSDAQSTGIYGINISVDKSTVAVNGKFHGWILNATDGTLRTDMQIANTESRLALSADASVLAIAELSGFVKAFAWNGSQGNYELLWQYRIPAGIFTNWVSSIDVSADGLTIMAGSLIFLSGGYDGSVYMFDTFGEGMPNWVYQGAGDMVDDIVLSDDGSIGAVVTWGDLANTTPDILIFERNSNSPVFSVNTPGSMFSVSISADGRSVIAGGKAVHARQFGNGGNVYNIGVDLGGGFISGTVTLTGAANNSGATVRVEGTIRTATTDSAGRYIVPNVPAGTRSVRVSKLGYVAATLTGIIVTQGDTTQNVNATLVQTGDPPTNLAASHSLESYIQLNWANPTSAAQRAYERLLAADEFATAEGNTSAILQGSGDNTISSPTWSDVVPPDSIRIYRAIRSGGPYYHKRTLAGALSSFRDSLVLPLRDYYYRVTAVYGNGESVYSNEAYGTVDSSFLQFSLTTPPLTTVPTVDGVLSTNEWSDALRVDVSDVFGNGGGVNLPRGSTFMYFKYDSTTRKLYIAGEDFLNTDGLASGEGFGLYFDDNHNEQFEPQGTNPLLREGNYWAYYFTTGPTVRFREIYTNGGVNAVVDTVFDAQAGMSSASGHFTGEVSIPISFFNKNHLQVYGPDKIVGAGLFLIGRDGGGNPLWHGWWPQTMTSVFSPTGFGDIEIPITLLAPPQAPANVGVAREGNHLRVTWTDPTHGINNEPLTVPVTLELYKNGTLLSPFAAGVQTFLDTNVVAQGWYEYKLRGSINVSGTDYYGPFSPTVGMFAVSEPVLTEIIYDDGIPEVFYVVDFTYNDNKFGIRFTPQNYPTKVYRVKAFTNNGRSPILVSIHEDSLGLPGAMLTGQYVGESYQISGVDSFLVTIPGTDPPVISSGSFFVVLSYLPTSPGAPGIGGDFTPPIDLRSFYHTTASGWVLMSSADLIVRAFVSDQQVGVEEKEEIPREFALLQNHPNPFNPSTVIRFQVPGSNLVSLKVYNVLGQEVSTLVNEEMKPGTYDVRWDAAGMASGVYFYRMQAGNFTETKKLVLMR